MSLEDIKRNKRLLQIAAELAGKGVGETPSVLGGHQQDEQEAIVPNRQVPEPVEEQMIDEDVEEFVNIILEEVKKVEESLDFELEDSDLDFVIEQIIDEFFEQN